MLETHKPSKDFNLKLKMDDFTKMIGWARCVHFRGKLDDLKNCQKILETDSNGNLEI